MALLLLTLPYLRIIMTKLESDVSVKAALLSGNCVGGLAKIPVLRGRGSSKDEQKVGLNQFKVE